MQYKATSVEDYISQLPQERQEPIKKLQSMVKENLPVGFEECLSYGMIGYVVPHTKYPSGYHCNPELPLPFINIASQKNFIALYHSGIYADPKLLDWFVLEYPKHSKRKLDMGKSCIRFKKTDEIPYKLIGELCGKITVNQWIKIYETNIKSRK